VVELELGIGNGTGEAWGCDLSYEYVKINASYTT
jgi:glutamate N-acetyltransferase / amino-acid N-acetyltransferase